MFTRFLTIYPKIHLNKFCLLISVILSYHLPTSFSITNNRNIYICHLLFCNISSINGSLFKKPKPPKIDNKKRNSTNSNSKTKTKISSINDSLFIEPKSPKIDNKKRKATKSNSKTKTKISLLNNSKKKKAAPPKTHIKSQIAAKTNFTSEKTIYVLPKNLDKNASPQKTHIKSQITTNPSIQSHKTIYYYVDSSKNSTPPPSPRIYIKNCDATANMIFITVIETSFLNIKIKFDNKKLENKPINNEKVWIIGAVFKNSMDLEFYQENFTDDTFKSQREFTDLCSRLEVKVGSDAILVKTKDCKDFLVFAHNDPNESFGNVKFRRNNIQELIKNRRRDDELVEELFENRKSGDEIALEMVKSFDLTWGNN